MQIQPDHHCKCDSKNSYCNNLDLIYNYVVGNVTVSDLYCFGSTAGVCTALVVFSNSRTVSGTEAWIGTVQRNCILIRKRTSLIYSIAACSHTLLIYCDIVLKEQLEQLSPVTY